MADVVACLDKDKTWEKIDYLLRWKCKFKIIETEIS